MNPKIKRQLKVYNDRFHTMGFKMSVDINSDPSFDFDFTVTLIQDNSHMGEKEIMKFISWPKDNHISLWMYDSSIHNLKTPQPVSDFLYYGMAILEDMQKGGKMNNPIKVWLGQDADATCSLFTSEPRMDYEETTYFPIDGNVIEFEEKNILGEKKSIKCVIITEEEYKRLLELVK